MCDFRLSAEKYTLELSTQKFWNSSLNVLLTAWVLMLNMVLNLLIHSGRRQHLNLTKRKKKLSLSVVLCNSLESYLTDGPCVFVVWILWVSLVLCKQALIINMTALTPKVSSNLSRHLTVIYWPEIKSWLNIHHRWIKYFWKKTLKNAFIENKKELSVDAWANRLHKLTQVWKPLLGLDGEQPVAPSLQGSWGFVLSVND